jgi:hypothetical protein
LRTLSDHIFDLVQNSLNAGAERIQVTVEEDVQENYFRITIKDDGHGIKPAHLARLKDTFFTTRPRKKRRVGLGLPLMDATCQRAGGSLSIESEYRFGTTVVATMEHDNIDRPPLGDLSDMFTSLMLSTVENRVIWTLEHVVGGKRYRLKNRATSDELNILSYAEPGVREKMYRLVSRKEKEINA